jgi:DNA-binding NarL/FixJ family response regulator
MDGRGCALSTPETSTNRRDPWRNLPPECRLYPDSPGFHTVIRDSLGDVVRVVTRPDAGPREAILVDCIESAASIVAARRLYPSHPVIGVLAREDAGRILEILAGGADGVITLAETPDTWRQCLHVVLGGGRWPEGSVGARAWG